MKTSENLQEREVLRNFIMGIFDKHKSIKIHNHEIIWRHRHTRIWRNCEVPIPCRLALHHCLTTFWAGKRIKSIEYFGMERKVVSKRNSISGRNCSWGRSRKTGTANCHPLAALSVTVSSTVNILVFIWIEISCTGGGFHSYFLFLWYIFIFLILKLK